MGLSWRVVGPYCEHLRVDGSPVQSEPNIVKFLLECGLASRGLAFSNEVAVAVAHDRLVKNSRKEACLRQGGRAAGRLGGVVVWWLTVR